MTGLRLILAISPDFALSDIGFLSTIMGGTVCWFSRILLVFSLLRPVWFELFSPDMDSVIELTRSFVVDWVFLEGANDMTFRS